MRASVSPSVRQSSSPLAPATGRSSAPLNAAISLVTAAAAAASTTSRRESPASPAAWRHRVPRAPADRASLEPQASSLAAAARRLPTREAGRIARSLAGVASGARFRLSPRFLRVLFPPIPRQSGAPQAATARRMHRARGFRKAARPPIGQPRPGSLKKARNSHYLPIAGPAPAASMRDPGSTLQAASARGVVCPRGRRRDAATLVRRSPLT